jgi:hypothetical protein
MAIAAAGLRPMRRTGSGSFVLVALVWSTMRLVLDLMLGSVAIRQIRALSYATTPGVITQSEVEVKPGLSRPD